VIAGGGPDRSLIALTRSPWAPPAASTSAFRHHRHVIRPATLLLLSTIRALAQHPAELIAQLLHRPDVRAKGRIVHTDATRKERVFQISLLRTAMRSSSMATLAPRLAIRQRPLQLERHDHGHFAQSSVADPADGLTSTASAPPPPSAAMSTATLRA
jgi:hypothetical protein